jgi:hypothetical protein
MAQFKGTKGKWILVNGIDSVWIENEVWTIADVSKKDLFIETQANALLISKAPEMLEMLEKINNHIKNNENKNYAVRLIAREFDIDRIIKEATEL